MTTPIFPLLRLLADGRFHSYADLRQELGLSSINLSEVLDELTMAGLEFARETAAGCKLITPFCPLDAAQIEHHLGDRAQMFSLEVVDQTGSTNQDLRQRARNGAASGLVCIAETQTAGRGRRGRKWLSAPGGTLTFSLLWNFASGPGELSGLPLAVGVSILRSLEALSLRGVQLKWPNDMLWQHRKLGGILIDTATSAGSTVSAVIGIGLNLRLPKTVVQQIDQPAADLESAGLQIGRNELLARLLCDLGDVLDEFSRNGFGALRAQWELSHAYQDKMVTVEMNDGVYLTGKAIGVDESGALLLQTAVGKRVIHSGELSLRAADMPGK